MKIPFKLAMTFGYFAQKYGKHLLSMNDPDVCAGLLGRALRDQRRLIEDEDSGTFMTLYDSVERLLEIKVMMHWTAAKMGLETKNKPPAEILPEIAKRAADRDPLAARDINETLAWATEFFSRPDVQEIFSDADIPVTLPSKASEVPKTFLSLGMRLQQEAKRLHNVLKVAKCKEDVANPEDCDADAEPEADDKRPPKQKPSAPKL